MMLKQATVASAAGLHARIVSLLAECASGYAGTAEIIWGENRAEAKSMLQLLAMGIPAGTELTIAVNGPDEAQMAAALASIIEMKE